MILADTSAGVDYLLGQNPKMQKRLAQAQIVMHPMIVAEISLGSLNNRRKRLQEMEALLEVRATKLAGVRHMVDAHLLASCLITPKPSSGPATAKWSESPTRSQSPSICPETIDSAHLLNSSLSAKPLPL